MSPSDDLRIQRAWEQIRTVNDPELPFLTAEEMGMIRSVQIQNGTLVVQITPTYSGCPATDVIQEDLSRAIEAVDPQCDVVVSLVPAWTTDWILPSAREKMLEHGIAPPEGKSADKAFLTGQGKTIPCPRCRSKETRMISAFGSTACKAQFVCRVCLEPFEHFKCI
jgi:ring-1,2-phenylacetyl-CoA epoxidase subunit PaaD